MKKYFISLKECFMIVVFCLTLCSVCVRVGAEWHKPVKISDIQDTMSYKISVITPFHNVDMKLFEDCAASMRRQTIGFENIEWIIVVHNCKQGYWQKLREMFINDDNVKLYELNNDCRTPSSPRNYGMQHVTSPYIGLLDGDDCYTSHCIEEVLRNADETNSDMLNVRREAVVTSPVIKSILVRTLFNNTEYRIIMEHGHWDTTKMFAGIWGMSTAYFYRTEMLTRNKITFDEEILMGEDFAFVLECIAHSRRVCYLNQLVGYRYIMNEESLVQLPSKPAAHLLAYAHGYKKIFNSMTRYGIDPTPLALILLSSVLSRFILFSPDMTHDIRVEIKQLVGSYISEMNKLMPDKIIPERALDERSYLIREVILNPERKLASFINLHLDDMRELKNILRLNNDTDMGRRNNFPTIVTLEAYQFRVPLTNAEFYRPLIDLQARIGETGIITKEPTTHYLQTESGALLPCNETHIKPYHELIATALNGHLNLCLEQSTPTIRKTNDNASVDTLHSLLVKYYFGRHYLEDGVVKAQFTSPIEAYFKVGEENYRTLVLQSLACKNVDQIVAFTASKVLDFFHYLEMHFNDLIDDVPCSEKRREQLRQIAAEGFDTPVAQKIWPKLQRIVAFGSGRFADACKRMKHYTGNITHNHGFFFTEESVFGRPVSDNNDTFEWIRDNDFYELIPLTGEDDTPLRWTTVKKGEPYRLVVTNHAGLYRYVTNHVIIPQEVSVETIRFTIPEESGAI